MGCELRGLDGWMDEGTRQDRAGQDKTRDGKRASCLFFENENFAGGEAHWHTKRQAEQRVACTQKGNWRGTALHIPNNEPQQELRSAYGGEIVPSSRCDRCHATARGHSGLFVAAGVLFVSIMYPSVILGRFMKSSGSGDERWKKRGSSQKLHTSLSLFPWRADETIVTQTMNAFWP